MKRDDERDPSAGMFKADVTAALAHGDPADRLQRGDELFAGDDR